MASPAAVKKSARVILTLAASVGIAARGQQGVDPCEAATFNAKVCKVAVKRHGYCSGGTWVPMQYQQQYPNYYDAYQAYLADGGQVADAPAENCGSRHLSGAHSAAYGGFGAIGGGHHVGG